MAFGSLSVDASSATKAAELLSELEIGPRPSRTNPAGSRRRIVDPRSELAREIAGLTTKALRSIRELTPRGTGRTRASYNVRRGGSSTSKGAAEFAVFEIGSDLPNDEQVIVSTLEYGSVPHVIRARGGGFLRIPLDPEDVASNVPGQGSGGSFAFVRDEEDGPVLYATEVSHPGTQPHAMFSRTLERMIPESDKVARRIVDKVARSFVAGSKTVNVDLGR